MNRVSTVEKKMQEWLGGSSGLGEGLGGSVGLGRQCWLGFLGGRRAGRKVCCRSVWRRWTLQAGVPGRGAGWECWGRAGRKCRAD
ncbi:hypothetical protein MRB53_023910 [Persea americana]|uniref:Uncharacterized protein n=1 Tax=Persea americana TaxID=3435 RepID=A0ACC2LBX5_PERAE|nr:hypothetical protein MRB53_023910 [Persea americana]